MKHATLHERMLSAVGQRSYREIGELTGTHQETVRRYLQGQAPSVDFLAALGRGLGLSGSWLLGGQGAMYVTDVREDALREADVAELLNAMADTINSMIERIERLEIFVQTMETRLRGGTSGNPGGSAAAPNTHDERSDGPDISIKARRIGRAVAQRPSDAAGGNDAAGGA
jgi:transcriptional regulator with XRE-family HTH domain